MGDISKMFCGLKFSTSVKDEDLHKVNGAIIELELRNKKLEQEVKELKESQQESGKIKNFLGNLNRTKEFKQFTLDNADLIRSFKK